MVDARATAKGKRKRDGGEKIAALDPVVAGLIQFEKDARLVDTATRELTLRRENLWIGAYRGVLHVEQSLHGLLTRFDAIGRSDVGISITFISADGQTRIIS